MKSELLPERSDVLLAGVAPKHIRKWLQQVGGVTPWGENRYRLVLAECVMLHCGGRWHDWAPGTDLHDQGSLEFAGQRKSRVVFTDPTRMSKTGKMALDLDVPALVGIRQSHPVRVVEEMRWIPRYEEKLKGWMLQVWFPSSYYCYEDYQKHVTGRPDLPLLGEFPAHGQYERQFAYSDRGLDGKFRIMETFPRIPGESWMQAAIEHNERVIAERSSNTDSDDTARKWRRLNAMIEMQNARAAYRRMKDREREAQIKDWISPLFGTSLAAGRFREEMAQRARSKGVVIGHCGN